MTEPAASRALPPPLNSGDADSDERSPAVPAVTPAEPARGDLVIAAGVAAAAVALVATLVLWRLSRRRLGQSG